MIFTGLELPREVLAYAKREFDDAKLGYIFLYRNVADKAFLALVIAVNAYIRTIEGATTLATRKVKERRLSVVH